MPINFPQIAKPINTIGLLNFVGKKRKNLRLKTTVSPTTSTTQGFFFFSKTPETQRNLPAALSATRSKSRFFISADKRVDQNSDSRQTSSSQPTQLPRLKKEKIWCTITQAGIHTGINCREQIHTMTKDPHATTSLKVDKGFFLGISFISTKTHGSERSPPL